MSVQLKIDALLDEPNWSVVTCKSDERRPIASIFQTKILKWIILEYLFKNKNIYREIHRMGIDVL